MPDVTSPHTQAMTNMGLTAADTAAARAHGISEVTIATIMSRYATVAVGTVGPGIVKNVLPRLAQAGLTSDDIAGIPAGVHTIVLDLLEDGFTRDQTEPIWHSGMSMTHAQRLVDLGVSYDHAVRAVQIDMLASVGAQTLIDAGMTVREIEHLIDTNTDLSRASRIASALSRQPSSNLTAPDERATLIAAARLVAMHPLIEPQAALETSRGCPPGAHDTLVTFVKDGMDLHAALKAAHALEQPARPITVSPTGGAHERHHAR